MFNRLTTRLLYHPVYPTVGTGLQVRLSLPSPSTLILKKIGLASSPTRFCSIPVPDERCVERTRRWAAPRPHGESRGVRATRAPVRCPDCERSAGNHGPGYPARVAAVPASPQQQVLALSLPPAWSSDRVDRKIGRLTPGGGGNDWARTWEL